jgi:two-component system response regulator FixJ
LTSREQTVHVIDDDDAVRDSIAFLLASAGIAAEVHASAVEYLAAAGPVPGCIVTDIRMPGLSGIDLLRELRGRGITTPVIVITGHGDVPLAVEAMKLGASDFIEKPFDDEALIGAIRSALDKSEGKDRTEQRRREIQERLSALSERERQVLDGLVEGKANKIIAFDLGISPRTVEIYRANVMAKMQAGSLSELVRMALAAGRSDGG